MREIRFDGMSSRSTSLFCECNGGIRCGAGVVIPRLAVAADEGVVEKANNVRQVLEAWSDDR